MGKNVYVAKNGDTGEKMQVPFTLLLFWITQGSHLLRELVDIFYPKNTWLFVTLETVCEKGVWNLDLSIYCKAIHL